MNGWVFLGLNKPISWTPLAMWNDSLRGTIQHTYLQSISNWAWKRKCWQLFQDANGGFQVPCVSTYCFGVNVNCVNLDYFKKSALYYIATISHLFQEKLPECLPAWKLCLTQPAAIFCPRGSISTFTMTLSSGHASRSTSSETSLVSSVGEKWSDLAG